MKSKGLTLTILVQASSANYGESLGNVASLKKVTRGDGYQYTYISRQALRYNIVQQLDEPLATLSAEGSGDKKVIQFDKDATIEAYPEIDFFGYMKTNKGTNAHVRSAKVRLSNAISLEPFRGDTDFLNNMGLAARLRKAKGDNSINNGLAQSEIHLSYYRYTVTIDLDQIGIDEAEDIQISNQEKARRVSKLLDVIAYLYRDIRGRREDLKPLFVIGGVYDIKNPVFQNIVDVKNNTVLIEGIKDVMTSELANQTETGVVSRKFTNTDEIKRELHATSVAKFFEVLKKKVADYYEGD
ncbi:type I-B CRISPR-associated protein Cas7/Cst2/DevR [Ligilactobacillus agilis]|uniref:Type I-B CRISPR-associated protein Cas7/Cst2/DevR n=1 Tax=Ligilactobacillus agilis TaxID=1601 RepID=A0A231Q710_9LACO|nr:type I-B CRISPR-associated protein Cas7/Cst2/DevR [Ligilactobacillus agilis]OXC06657.1 type I-B CRISPR-associated protein Cas7/Cst2/DevR [Ligilactobacillus agilis]OXC08305.1 type I-B CRISPR-associated protein Cas7/Cst2/DevR [Ligilactobacillus agilis]OXC08869.1 type I-B CRISPR-associated protein Cas7/Cst2/DevR [Ligilactobacillus agilis]OXS40847.1 type I-B CRISPR-associated protein Cas7/Cst2/DevR [Ligilactobacillus agilis]OXS42245.1 type I-B CRISPR-associated protein Cas7/Cst2/DevR [Ligilacto